MSTNTKETQSLAEVNKSFIKGVFPPQIKIPLTPNSNSKESLVLLEKQFKKAKKAFKLSKENFLSLKVAGKSKKVLAKAKAERILAKAKRDKIEEKIRMIKVSA